MVPELRLVRIVEARQRGDVGAVPLLDVLTRRVGDLRQAHGLRDDRVQRDVVARQQRAPPARAPEDRDDEPEARQRKLAYRTVERRVQVRVEVALAEREGR